MRKMRARIRLKSARALKFASRKIGRVAAAVARRLGLQKKGLGGLQRRFHVALDNATLQERVRGGFLSTARSRARLEAFERMVEEAFGEMDEPGDYLEFGVYFGRSLVHAYRALERRCPDYAIRCIGFDSFKGMPREAAREAGPWVPRQYCSGKDFVYSYLTESGVDMSRVELVEGWFSETLRPDISSNLGIEKIAVAMIDCDIQSSTRLALEFCGPLIVDTSYLFFDDWSARGVPAGEGQERAFKEFLNKNPHLSATYVDRYSPDSAVYRVDNLTSNP